VGDVVQRYDRGELERAYEVQDRVAIVATPDRRIPLDRDDVGAVLERASGAGVVGALVTPDPVMDLEGVRRDGLGGMERDDLPIGRDPTQLAGERGDAALARGIRRDERDAGDFSSDRLGRGAGKKKNGPSRRTGRSSRR